MTGRLTYDRSGVSYNALDVLKRLAQRGALQTQKRARHVRGVSRSLGESAYVWEEKDCYRALVIEGLGTKNLVADAMRSITKKTYYDALAQDTVSAIVNDLITVGAAPQVVNAYFAVGDSTWFSDTTRARDLVRGWVNACELAGAVWGGGETPALTGVVHDAVIDLAGSAVGIIQPKRRLTLGDRLRAGDKILLIESSGIHANGLTLARKLAETLPKGYASPLPNGMLYGEALLRPTHIYARLVQDMFDEGIDIHYMVNITGHGWRKLMRANSTFTYSIETIPEPQPIFSFIQKHSGNDDSEMYATFNMGAGFALFLPPQHAPRADKIIQSHKLKSWHAGVVKNGPKQVIIHPKGITYAANSLGVRS